MNRKDTTTKTSVTVRYYDKLQSSLPPFVHASREVIVTHEDGENSEHLFYRASSETNTLNYMGVVATLAATQLLQLHQVSES